MVKCGDFVYDLSFRTESRTVTLIGVSIAVPKSLMLVSMHLRVVNARECTADLWGF